MIEYISYILFFITIIILISYIYIRIKYGFWVVQPVFHVYDIGYMLYPPGIINHKLPKKNKYTNFKNINTIIYTDLSEIKINQLINFIKINYLQNKNNVFNPSKDNINPYFSGHSAKSFVTFYNEENTLIDLKKSTTIQDTKIIGIITSRPIHITINNGDKDAVFDAYYIDYLCVDKSFRKKGIAPQIIQTHHYNQSHLNTNICVSLFKREDELTGIVPLCVYSTYGFSVDKWTKPIELSAEYKLLEINPQNFHYLYNFIKSTTANFDIVINTELTNIIELIKTKNIFVYVIIVKDEIICAYFYRKSCTYIETNMEVLSCFASINNCDNNDIFIQGFKISFWKIAEENYFGFAAIENISHNYIIINNLIIKTTPLIISPTAYFFYNFAYNTFKPEKVLIIN
uniref:glycylpeptide N-tetradecanoyltransferase n=1 Tax=viral metagenome TaxID=1070528 RepID=A0A6C0EUU4_9ZZZZ